MTRSAMHRLVTAVATGGVLVQRVICSQPNRSGVAPWCAGSGQSRQTPTGGPLQPGGRLPARTERAQHSTSSKSTSGDNWGLAPTDGG